MYVGLTCPMWWVSNLQVEDLEESMHKDVSSVAHRQELKHSELQALISTLNHDLKGLQREVRMVDLSAASYFKHDVVKDEGEVTYTHVTSCVALGCFQHHALAKLHAAAMAARASEADGPDMAILGRACQYVFTRC